MAVNSVSQGSASPVQKDPLTTPEESLMDSQDDSILCVSFNQDFGCFACGTEQGFRVYNCEPMRETFRRDFPNGGFRVTEMLFQSNIMALVGGQHPPSKVMIWDDNQKRYIGEMSFRTEVRAVRLRRDRIVVVLDNKIYVYNFVNFKLLNQYSTIANPRGLCAISHRADNFVLACPGLPKGQVRIEHYAKKRTEFINVHDSQIASLALTHDGTLLASASTKGTLVRIFNTADGTKLQELRRGADIAEIYSLAFSPNLQWLAVSSDKGTVHIFGLDVPKNRADRRGNGAVQCSSPGSNPGSSLSFMRGVLPKYFNSQWSFAQFHLPKSLQYLVAFGNQQNTIITVGLDGSFYRCAFDPVHGGEMEQKEYERFLKPEAPDSL